GCGVGGGSYGHRETEALVSVIELHARIGEAVRGSQEPVEGHAAATQDGAARVGDLDERIEQLDDLGTAGGGVRVWWYAAPGACLAEAVEAAGDSRRDCRCACSRRHLASAGCWSRWQARPGSPVELFLPESGRGRCSGVGGFGCLAEVDDGWGGDADTARTPGGGRGRRPSDIQQPGYCEPANAGQYEVAPQLPSSECLRADDRGPIWTPRVIAHGCTLFLPGARPHGYRL